MAKRRKPPTPPANVDLRAVALDTLQADFLAHIFTKAILDVMINDAGVSPEIADHFTAMIIRRAKELLKEYEANGQPGPDDNPAA